MLQWTSLCCNDHLNKNTFQKVFCKTSKVVSGDRVPMWYFVFVFHIVKTVWDISPVSFSMYLYLIFFLFCLISFTQKKNCHCIFLKLYLSTIICLMNFSVYKLKESSRQETFKRCYILKIIWDIMVNNSSMQRACGTRPSVKLNRASAVLHSKVHKKEAVPKPCIYHEMLYAAEQIHTQIWLLNPLWIEARSPSHLPGFRQQIPGKLLGEPHVPCWNVHVYLADLFARAHLWSRQPLLSQKWLCQMFSPLP